MTVFEQQGNQAAHAPLVEGRVPRICLVTSTHVSYNPRLVKEADALSEAGYRVRVVGLNREDWKWQLDRALVEGRSWVYEAVDARPNSALGAARRALSKARASTNEKLSRYLSLPNGLERSFSRYYPEIAALAARERADLYIAHVLPALPAAAAAARKWGAKLGFDAEDFHRGEFSDRPDDARLLAETIAVEEKYIPRCDYVSASSDGIAESYAESLSIPRPTTILNVFPRNSKAAALGNAALSGERPSQGLSLYWFSQVIGPGRGLEVALRAVALCPHLVHFSMRGTWAEGYKNELMRVARDLKVVDRIHELEPRPPEELIARASLHDVGLAGELPNTVNHRLAVSNKLFTYVLAGLPMAVSDVPSQVSIMRQMGGAGFVYGAEDPTSLAAGLATFVEHPERLREARRQALHVAETRFCWEVESPNFVRLVDGVVLATLRGRDD